MNVVPLDRIPLSAFEAAVRSRFQVALDDARSITLELAEVSRPRTAPEARFESFALVFTGPREPALPQQIFRLEHEHIGAFDLFLVPIACDAAGMKYEAVFNRPGPAPGRRMNSSLHG